MEAEAEAEAVALKGDAEAYAIEIKAKAEVRFEDDNMDYDKFCDSNRADVDDSRSFI